MSRVTSTSKAGIVESKTGERHIPSSTRADGTKRKEIKIRPGYKPVEDVEVYKNRCAESWKSSKSVEVPGAEGLKEVRNKSLAAINKSEKIKEAKKKSQSASQLSLDEGNRGMAEEASQPINPEADREKKIRNLKKKLKQATDLKEKKDKGTILFPEQLTKIIRINELVWELENLGINTDDKPTTGVVESKAK